MSIDTIDNHDLSLAITTAEVRRWLDQNSAATRKRWTKKVRFSDREHPAREDRNRSIQHQLRRNSLEPMDESNSYGSRSQPVAPGSGSAAITDWDNWDNIMETRILYEDSTDDSDYSDASNPSSPFLKFESPPQSYRIIHYTLPQDETTTPLSSAVTNRSAPFPVHGATDEPCPLRHTVIQMDGFHSGATRSSLGTSQIPPHLQYIYRQVTPPLSLLQTTNAMNAGEGQYAMQACYLMVA